MRSRKASGVREKSLRDSKSVAALPFGGWGQAVPVTSAKPSQAKLLTREHQEEERGFPSPPNN